MLSVRAVSVIGYRRLPVRMSETVDRSQRSGGSFAYPASATHDSCSGNMSSAPPSPQSPSIDAQPVCPVSHGPSKKIVALTGPRKLADLQESLRKSGFAHLMTSNPLIQIYNERFQCFVDFDESTTVNDGALSTWLSHGTTLEAVEQPYPKKLYKAAAVTLVNTYPQLRDSSDSGYASWYMCLLNKYKNMRKRMPPGCPEVDAQKAKFKARNLGESPVASSKTGFRRQTIVKSTFEMGSAFVTEATDFMKRELKKQNPNMEKVEDAMLRTTVARRRSIELDGMSLTDVVSHYPALTLEKGILNECRRLTGVSPDEALLRALGEFGEHILNAAAHKQAAQSTLCSLQNEISVDNRIARNYAKGVAAIMVLPFLVSE